MKSFIPAAVAALVLCSCGASRTASDPYAIPGPPSEDNIQVGYGTVDRKDLTYSVGHVEVNQNEVGNYGDIWEYLRGRLPGVVIGPASGGETPSITIRGESSLNASNEPLILLDGSEVGDISFLNPNDVASVSVLKDGAAAMYGSRGANGVIILTTKSAKLAAEQEREFMREAREAAKAARQAKKEARAARKRGK